MNPGDEIVAIVDRENRVVGSAPRRRMRAEGLPHRATYIFVRNSRGALFVQKRTNTKDVYPGFYDAAAGGVVQAGEDYESSAARELAEELGIRGVPLRPLFDFHWTDEHSDVWGRAYECTFDGEPVLQAEEIESGRFCSVEEVLSGSVSPVTPDTLYALRRLAERA